MTDQQAHREAPSGFCVLPWLSHFRDNDGSVRPCCQFEGVVPDIKNLKKKMLEGEWDQGCFKCQQCEAHEGRSYRQQKNLEYREEASAILENKKVPQVDLDLRVGNHCNLRCRMCDPQSTKLWVKDWNDTHPEPLKISDNEKKKLNSTPWTQNHQKWEKYLKMAGELKSISFAGGEPFLSQETFHFLEQLVAQKESAHIRLTFITNLTSLPKKFLELFTHFESVDLTISLDGYGKWNDYIRTYSQFEQIDKNLKFINEQYKELNLKRVSVNTTLQILNVWEIPKLVDYLSDFKNVITLPYLSPLMHPEYMSVQVLPQDIRGKAIRDCQKILNDQSHNPSWVVESFYHAQNFLSNQSANHEELYRIFKQENLKMDQFDGISLKEIDPELYMAIYLGS